MRKQVGRRRKEGPKNARNAISCVFVQLFRRCATGANRSTHWGESLHSLGRIAPPRRSRCTQTAANGSRRQKKQPYRPPLLTLRLLRCLRGESKKPGLSRENREDTQRRLQIRRRKADHVPRYVLLPAWTPKPTRQIGFESRSRHCLLRSSPPFGAIFRNQRGSQPPAAGQT